MAKRHLTRLRPTREDTPTDIEARQFYYAALEQARLDVDAQFPNGINADNALEYVTFQAQRIDARIKEMC